MTVVRTGKARPFARSTPSGAFDQYLLDIQKLPMISDPDAVTDVIVDAARATS